MNLGAGKLSTATDSGISYLHDVDQVKSSQLVLDGSGRMGGLHGNWFQITYRMKANYNVNGTDAGSTLNVYTADDDLGRWSAAGKASGGVYDPTGVWFTKTFFVYTPTVPRVTALKVRGWGPIFPICEGWPDVASIIPIDGPGQNNVVGNGAVTKGLPPGTMAMVPPDQSTTDPVSVTSGNYTQLHTDLALPGLGVPLAFTRTYSAQAAASGPLGSPSVSGGEVVAQLAGGPDGV